jgi:hypothetical protein
MASFWRMYCHRRETWNSHIAHTIVVYLYFFFNDGLTVNYLYDNGLLAEHKKVHLVSKKKPFKIPLKTLTAGD